MDVDNKNNLLLTFLYLENYWVGFWILEAQNLRKLNNSEREREKERKGNRISKAYGMEITQLISSKPGNKIVKYAMGSL